MHPTALIRAARPTDVETIHALVNGHDPDDFLLPFSQQEAAAAVAEFVVAEDGGRVVGVGRLKRFTDSLGEIRSLIVAREHRHQDFGRNIVRALLDRARATGLTHVFVLTYRLHFFERLGFVVIRKEILPVKIWGDCLLCDRREACDETAMWIVL
jgi:amino-acid N-acetyltransferase